MNTLRIRGLGLAAVATLIGASMAQAEEHATFHLPVAAHWGSAILQPGDYNVSLPALSLEQPGFRITGSGKTINELPVVTDIRPNLNSSYIILSEINGDYFVREFASASAGKAFRFPVPKTKQSSQVAKVENSNLPVYSNGGSQ